MKCCLPNEELKFALAHVADHMASAGPRKIGPARSDEPVLVVTDGACKDAGAPVGRRMICGDIIQCFGFVVSQDQVDEDKTKAWQKRSLDRQICSQSC